jgi:hypothetical protein
MALVVTRIAPTLLTSVIATLVTVSAPAETPTTTAAPDCLVKPNGPAATGSHWYYHIDHPSGRHCWYQRPLDAAKDVPAQPHAATAAAPTSRPGAAPAPRPPSDTSAPTVASAADTSANVVPPIAAAGPPPFGLFGAAVIPATPPAAAASASVPVPPIDSASPPPAVAPAIDPKVMTPEPQHDAASAQQIPVRTLSVVRPDESDETSHVPALFGAVSALAIIILGSFVGRFLTERQRRRAPINSRAHDRQSPLSRLQESPGIVPVMPVGAARETHAPWPEPSTSPDDWGLPRSRRQRRVAPSAAASRETTRVLEDNVRELLGRLQSELRARPSEPPRAASALPVAHVPTTQELDAVLAIWQAKRRGE